jgi:alpha-N-acetylglucosamine transferase
MHGAIRINFDKGRFKLPRQAPSTSSRSLDLKNKHVVFCFFILLLTIFCSIAIFFNYYNISRLESMSETSFADTKLPTRFSQPFAADDVNTNEVQQMQMETTMANAEFRPVHHETVDDLARVDDEIAPRYAYATLLSSSEFVKGTMALMHSLQLTGTPHPLMVLVLPHIPYTVRNLLKQMGLIVVEISYIQNPNLARMVAARQKFNFCKLNVWRMVEYDRIIMMGKGFVHFIRTLT